MEKPGAYDPIPAPIDHLCQCNIQPLAPVFLLNVEMAVPDIRELHFSDITAPLPGDHSQ